MQRTQAEIDANAPLKAAETKYYTDTKGKPVMADQDGFAMQQGPDGNWTYQTDADGNKVKLNKAGGSARNPEGVVGAIADDLQKADPNLSRADALEKARSGKGAQVELSKERLAQGAWKTDADPSGNPKHTLDYWRQQYGLPPMATNAPAPIPSASASPSPSPTPSAVTQPAKTAAAPAPAAPGAAMAAEPAAPSSSQDAVGTQTNPAKPMSQDDFNALPSGSWFVNPADKRLLRKK
jgi:hypothetical protein